MQAPLPAARANSAPAPLILRSDLDGVALLALNRPQTRNTLSEAMLLALSEMLTTIAADRNVRAVVLAGYMELLGAGFLARFPGAVINVHPSLLPAFPGVRAIEQALAYGVKVFGVTVHFVDEGVDSGPVILQRAIALPDAREPEQVLAALRPLEHAMLGEAVQLLARGALRADPANPRRQIIEPSARREGEG